MAQRLSSRVLAGRTAELDQLLAAAARCAEGSPSVVLVGGEAGIGKSRLVAELAARVTDDGAARVLWGQCADLEEAAIPLLPVVTAVSDLDGDDLIPAARPGGAASSLLGAAPTARLHALVLDRLARAAAEDPVVLVVEDVHWADRSTLDLLAFLARHLREEQVLVVATYRDDEVDRREPLRRFLADAATAPTAERIVLTRLTREQTAEQLAGILDDAPADDLLDAVFARAEGNPFFAEELVAAGAAGALSPTLRDMLRTRLATLDAPAQTVVRVAAAGGREVHHRLLAAAAGLGEPELTEALRDAVRQQVLVAREDGFAFRHALLQEVAYGELLPGERARVHTAFASALETSADVAGGNAATIAAEIAHHWLRAGDEPRALAAAVRAGDEAVRIGALAEAAGHDGNALALWEAVPDAEEAAGVDRATLLGRRAYAVAWTGRPDEAVLLVDEALVLVDPDTEPVRAAMLHRDRGNFMWHLGRPDEGVPDLERAVALVPVQPPSAERAQVLGRLGLNLLLSGDPAGSRELSKAAIAVAREAGDRAEEADALVCLGQSIVALGEPAPGIAYLREARAIATQIDDDAVLSHAGVGLSDSLWRNGQLEEAIEVGLEGAEVARRVGMGVREAVCTLNSAEAAFELGRWDLTDRLTRETLDRDLSGMARAFAHHVAGALACARGDLDGAQAQLAAQREALGANATTPEDDVPEDAAMLALWQRRPQDAVGAVREGLSGGVLDRARRVRLVWLGVRAQADLAELARARRDEDGERVAREQAHALHDGGEVDGNPGMDSVIAAERTRADGESDPALWDAAARAWEQRPWPFAGAYARWRQAEAALARRDRAQAVAALTAAYATAVTLGAGGLRAEVQALARRARIDLPDEERAPAEKAPPGMPDAAAELGLTARELEVLEHIALGQTNRQIADELFISVKTAGVHVSHILGKLGAANRGEAGAIAHRLGLVP